jgi:RNA polymerase sigma-70 factor (ECF subfamily)
MTRLEATPRLTSGPHEFTAIFEQHFDAIHRYIARRLGTDAADDLAAQVFAEAFANRDHYRSELGEVRPWLFGIATNLIRRHHRREQAAWRAYAKHGADPLGIDAQPRLDEIAVAKALGTLHARDRDALLLFVWADLTYDEIAAVLEIPVGTVRSRINRARTRLRSELETLQ